MILLTQYFTVRLTRFFDGDELALTGEAAVPVTGLRERHEGWMSGGQDERGEQGL